MSRLILVRYAVGAVALVLAFALGHAVTVVSTPEPKPEVVVTNMPACVAEMADAHQAERARRDTADQHAVLVRELSADRYEAELTADDETIADAAKALDTELRLEQAARNEVAEAAAAFDAAEAECLGGAK